MDRLLRKLHTESFVLTLRDPRRRARSSRATTSSSSTTTRSRWRSKEQNLNDLFARLSASGIAVLSMRNKVNRLEEMFMRLVDKENGARVRPRRSRRRHP
jgi:ABC-2 type transport system ATP-binding protein